MDATAIDSPETALSADGHADLGEVLDAAACERIAALWEDEALFRSRIDMRRHGFGEGVYKYFAAPVPEEIAALRRALYARLVPVANLWEEMLGTGRRFPDAHEAFIARCHADGQTKPTPLLLSYGAGDYNCLHQDLYGPHVFPLQVVILLSDPAGFSGGEFVLTEQRPRMQSRAEVVPQPRGHAIAFAVADRPKRGTRGVYRVKQRHGVSRLRAGSRMTLGIIFHDAA